MWDIRTFKTLKALRNWQDANSYKAQIIEIFIDNGYAVEYKKLRIINI